MTNELEKQFFDTFGIEPKNISSGECKYKITPEFCESNCLDCKNTIKEATYPQITDRILLQLQEILLQHNINVEYSHFNDGDYYCSCSIPLANGKGKTFKEAFLDMLISIGEDYAESCCYDGQDVIYDQVRTLFEEG